MFQWVNNHTPEGWRQYYKRNQDILDIRIDKLAKELKPMAKDTYHLDRRASKRQRRVYNYTDEDEEDEVSPCATPAPKRQKLISRNARGSKEVLRHSEDIDEEESSDEESRHE